jgi:hypothetical protein
MNRRDLCPPSLLTLDNAMEDFMQEYRQKQGLDAEHQNAAEEILPRFEQPKPQPVWPGYVICGLLFFLAFYVYLRIFMEATW